MVISLCACGNNEKAEKYCSSCGEGITKDAAFCEHCGAAVNNEKVESEDTSSDNSSSNESKIEKTSRPSSSIESTSKPTETNKPITSSKPSSSTTPSTNKPSTPTHTHSYSKKITAATCTEKGYTTYTCSCGDTYVSDYTNLGSHSYSKYVCSNCGVVDKAHAYEYLIEWVKNKGTKKDGQIDYIFEDNNNSYDRYILTYSVTENCLLVQHGYEETLYGYHLFTAIFLDNFSYGFSFGSDTIFGSINPETYTVNSALSYTSSECTVLSPEKCLSGAKSAINLLLAYLNEFLINENLSITISDLGFKSFEY